MDGQNIPYLHLFQLFSEVQFKNIYIKKKNTQLKLTSDFRELSENASYTFFQSKD